MSAEIIQCPSCKAQFGLQEKCCPNCGRWTAARGFTFYFFWIALSLVVIALVGDILHSGFVMLTRML